MTETPLAEEISMETLEAPVESVEQSATDVAAESAGMESGFTDQGTETPPETVTPEPTPDTTTTASLETTSAEPAPEYVQLTKQEHAKLLKLVDEGFGRLGTMQQVVQQLQASTPKGEPIQATEEDFKEMMAEEGFPEVGKMALAGFNRLLSRFKGTGGAATIDTTALIAQAKAEAIQDMTAAQMKETTAELVSEHPDLWAVVGDHTKIKTSPNAFQTWVAKQGEVFEQRIWNSKNPDFLARQVTRFKTETAKKPTPTPTSNRTEDRRAQVLADAVLPKGAGGGTTKSGPQTEWEGLEAGFKG